MKLLFKSCIIIGLLTRVVFSLNETANKEFVLVDTVKIPLGYSKQLIKYRIGKIYIPSKWGGTLRIEGGPVELYYTDGSILTKENAIKIAKDEMSSNLIASGSPCEYNVPANKYKWYYVRFTGSASATISSKFFQNALTTKRPWNFYWWSRGATSPTLYTIGGALSKYDDINGTTARDWEETNDKDVLGWSGHCLGASIASVLLKQPNPISTSGLSNDEMEGLWAELGEHSSGVIIPDGFGGCPAGPPTAGVDATDSYAPQLHRMFEQYIFGAKTPLQSNLRAGAGSSDPTAVWNHGIYKYDAEYSEDTGGDEKCVQIKITIYANADHTPPTNGTADFRSINYEYKVTYHQNGNTDASAAADWMSIAGDASFSPSNMLYITDHTWSGDNPHVLESLVKSLDNSN